MKGNGIIAKKAITILRRRGDGRTLDLDFTTGVLDSRITFSRTSLGTYVHSDGLLYGADTSTSSQTIGSSGTKTFTLAATAGVNRRYAVGDTVIASSGANNMSGTVTSYDPATQVLVFTATSSSGSGTFTSWIIGTRMARFDYNPTTLAPRGLLIEGSATNLLFQSENMTNNAFPGWGTRTNLTSVTSGFTAPDNSTNAVKIVANGTNGSHYLGTGNNTIVNGTTYTASCFVKPSGYGIFGLVTTNSQTRASFNLAGNSSSGYGITNTRTITAYANGWYRVTMTWTSSTTSVEFWLAVQNTVQDPVSSWVGNATDGVEVWGAQLETGSGASSYIPTAASQATRAVDEATMTSTNFSAWFNALTGTLAAYGQRRLTSDFGRLASINDNTADESLDLGGSTTGKWVIRDGGSDVADITPGTVTANTDFKIAGAYAVNDAQAAFGGTLGTADTSLTLPTVDRMMIGRQAGTSVYLNGTISRLIYWPLRLPNATLQSLTQ